MGRLIYLSGGARSGKSAYAQHLAEACSGELLYVATAGIHDAEMEARVQKHRADRGERWSALEEPLDLVGRLLPVAERKGAILLDCVTLWVTNLLFQHGEHSDPVLAEVDRFIAVLPQITAPLFVVSNEVGFGIVPENVLARQFRDLAGTVNQRLARAADEAWLVVSGLPVRLK
jgi:adenosylcobinamide kinase/adenosylcobinamide-phosphate guanylyltransferase